MPEEQTETLLRKASRFAQLCFWFAVLSGLVNESAHPHVSGQSGEGWGWLLGGALWCGLIVVEVRSGTAFVARFTDCHRSTHRVSYWTFVAVHVAIGAVLLIGACRALLNV